VPLVLLPPMPPSDDSSELPREDKLPLDELFVEPDEDVDVDVEVDVEVVLVVLLTWPFSLALAALEQMSAVCWSATTA